MELVLGTAAFLNCYGVSGNSSGANLDDVGEILAEAFSGGFSSVDTAPSYGGSEEAVGESKWVGGIHTKLLSEIDPMTSLQGSLRRLQRSSVDLLYLFHEPGKWAGSSEFELFRLASPLKSHTERIGVSIYTPEELLRFSTFACIDVIQAPVNAFQTGILSALEHLPESRPKIFGRSVFLQGLLAAPNAVTAVSGLAEYLVKFHKLAEELGRTSSELAIQYVKGLENIDGLVLGVKHRREMAALVKALNAGSLSDNERRAVDSLPKPPPGAIDPRRWR